MEPDKTYPLHPDQNDQPSTPRTPPVSSSNNTSLQPPSSYNPPQNTTAADLAAVPWYLQPLTKTTQSPLTSTQTRPFVPREPLPPKQRAESIATPAVQQAVQTPIQSTPAPAAAETSELTNLFGAQPLPPLRSPYANPSQHQSVYRRPSEPEPQRSAYERPPVPKQQAPAYQQSSAPAASVSSPKPFSQFGELAPARPVYEKSATNPNNIRRIIGIAIALLVVVLIGVGVYSLFQRSGSDDSGSSASNTPVDESKDRLHQAFEKHLQTRFVRQSYEQTADGVNADILKLDTTSDFSDPSRPKSYIRYDVQSGRGENAIKGAGEIIVLDTNEYYGKLTMPVLFYQGDEADKPKENQWYQIAGDDATGELLLDPTTARMGLNSPLGELPVGNFSDGARQELIQFIKARNVYAIKNSKQVTEDNKKITHYTIEFNPGLVNELNKKIADAIGQKDLAAVPVFAANDVKNMEIWVNNESGRITKVKYNRQYSSNADNAAPIKETITVAISYPQDGSSVKKPEGAVAGPWATRN